MLWGFFTLGKGLAKCLGHRSQLIDTLRTGQAQGHLPCPIEPLMKIPQSLLKFGLRHRQAVAIAGMETSQRMSLAKPIKQCLLSLRCRILRPRDKFRL